MFPPKYPLGTAMTRTSLRPSESVSDSITGADNVAVSTPTGASRFTPTDTLATPGSPRAAETPTLFAGESPRGAR